jgi:glucose dehydrogenase
MSYDENASNNSYNVPIVHIHEYRSKQWAGWPNCVPASSVLSFVFQDNCMRWNWWAIAVEPRERHGMVWDYVSHFGAKQYSDTIVGARLCMVN